MLMDMHLERQLNRDSGMMLMNCMQILLSHVNGSNRLRVTGGPSTGKVLPRNRSHQEKRKVGKYPAT